MPPLDEDTSNKSTSPENPDTPPNTRETTKETSVETEAQRTSGNLGSIDDLLRAAAYDSNEAPPRKRERDQEEAGPPNKKVRWDLSQDEDEDADAESEEDSLPPSDSDGTISLHLDKSPGSLPEVEGAEDRSPGNEQNSRVVIDLCDTSSDDIAQDLSPARHEIIDLRGSSSDIKVPKYRLPSIGVFKVRSPEPGEILDPTGYVDAYSGPNPYDTDNEFEKKISKLRTIRACKKEIAHLHKLDSENWEHLDRRFKAHSEQSAWVDHDWGVVSEQGPLTEEQQLEFRKAVLNCVRINSKNLEDKATWKHRFKTRLTKLEKRLKEFEAEIEAGKRVPANQESTSEESSSEEEVVTEEKPFTEKEAASELEASVENEASAEKEVTTEAEAPTDE